MSESQPLNLLKKSINKTVIVKLKSGSEFKGKLAEMDAYMNVVLVNATEVENDQVVAEYSRIFVRGNNILFIKPNAEDE
ncbi:MAG: U6 snRNA-associated Sm-like protein LSm6 [Candidatus Asgardarchaeia archaeon]